MAQLYSLGAVMVVVPLSVMMMIVLLNRSYRRYIHYSLSLSLSRRDR